MKKVLYLFDTLNRGGAETSTLEIARRLKNFTPVVLTIFEGTNLKSKFENEGITVHALNYKSKKRIFHIYKAIETIIENENPDIIHSNLFHSDQYARVIGRKNKIPVVNSFVNDSYAEERYELLNFKEKIALNFYRTIDRIFSKNVAQFISLTHAIIPNNIKALGVNSKRVVVIPRGRDFEAMKNRIDDEMVRELHKNFEHKTIILTVSRLLIRKGYLESIRAIADVVKKKPNIHYLIAGEGHDREKFEKLIDELNLNKHITLLGNCENIPSLLFASDIFLFPSHYEGQGGALVEAMAFGKKIIATRIPVLQESVKDNYSALLFSYRNHNDLAEKIIWALQNPEVMERYSKNAEKEALNRFAIEDIVQKHENLYKNVIKRS